MAKKKTEEELDKWMKEHTKKWNKIFKEKGCLHWENDKDANN
tara:strand:+ start:269 stop:394 length:126 start_codon:yes stop_codon:yes gene_type:complete